MKKVIFSDGMKPLTSDMNALSSNTEDALSTLLSAVGGSSGKILFEAAEPITAYDGSTVLLTVPQQHFAIGGAIGVVPETTRTIASTGDRQIGIYFILKKFPTEEVRNFISLDDEDNILIQQDMSATVATEDIGRVEFLHVGDLVTPVDEPVLALNDADFIRLGTVVLDISATPQLTFNLNTAEVFTLPNNVGQAISKHASTHLTGGSDAIDPAKMNSGVIGGSMPGIMPYGSLATTMGSIQNIESESTYLSTVAQGDNEAFADGTRNEKTITLKINTDDSLVATGESGETLGVNFPSKSALYGIYDKAARWDHAHPLADTGVIIHSFTLPINQTTAFGEVYGPYTVNAASSGGDSGDKVGRIVGFHIYWIPPNQINNAQTAIACSWVPFFDGSSMETVGCRGIITSKDSFCLELGARGVAYLSDKTLLYLADRANWQYGNYAVAGSIRVDVFAIRDGSFSNQSTSIS